MPKLSATVRLRPIRIAFLVEPTDIASIKRIVRLNSCLWGGIYNPIIPVFEQLPLRWARDTHEGGLEIGKGYLRFFEPDVVVEAKEKMAESLGWHEIDQSWRTARRITLNEFVAAGSHGQRPALHCGLEVTSAYQASYDEAYRFTARHPREVALIDPDNSGDGFLEICAGAFPKGELLGNVSPFFEAAFSPRKFDNTAKSYLEVIAGSMPTPLSVGAHSIEASFSDWKDGTVFVFDPEDGQDIIDFWNLRLFQRDVVPAHVGWLSECRQFLRGVIERTYRPIPGNPHGTKFQATLEFARSISEERAKELTQQHFSGLTSGSLVVKHWYDPIWRTSPANHGPRYRRALLNAGQRDVEVEYEVGQAAIGFDGVAPEFDSGLHSQPTHANVVQFSKFGLPPSFAAVYPNNILDASYPDIARRDWILTTREGWVFPLSSVGDIYFSVPDSQSAIIGWLKRQGIEATATAVSRIALYIIEAVGGTTGAGLLADEETLRLLESMASTIVEYDSTDTRRRVERRYPDKARSARDWISLTKRRQKKLFQSWVTVDRFVDARILRLGLSVPCPNCRTENWYALDGLSYQLRCDHCLKEFPHPQARPYWQNQWQYRVSGPFASPGFAQGAYTTVLTLRAFQALGSIGTAQTWTSGLLLPDNREIDLALWYRREGAGRDGEEPRFIIGEAKSFGEGDIVKGKDIETLKWTAERLPGAFMVVSVLKRAFTRSEKQRLVELARWGRSTRINGEPRNPLIVLTGTELFADHDIRAEWKAAGGLAAELTKHPSTRLDNLIELAEITQRVYLDLPPFYDDLKPAKPEDDPLLPG